MTPEKATKFIMELMKSTSEGEIDWKIIDGDPELQLRLPFKAKGVGYGYQVSIDRNYCALFRYQRPVFDDSISPLGWDDDEIYELQVCDKDGIFIYRFPWSPAIGDLYSIVDKNFTPIDDFVDGFLNR